MLIALGRAQYQVGRIAEATRAFDSALELARARDDNVMRALELLSVVEAKVEVGSTADADATLAQIVETAQSTTDASRRAVLLPRIALAQENIGRHEDAVATYREALAATDAIPNASTRGNALFGMIGGPIGRQPARLIAEFAPQVARIAQSIEGELRRSSALVVIASALPN